MLGDLKFSDSVYGVGAGSIFFLGYYFEIPSIIMLQRWARVDSAAHRYQKYSFSALTASALMHQQRTPACWSCRLFFRHDLTLPSPSPPPVALLMAGNPLSGIIGVRHFHHAALRRNQGNGRAVMALHPEGIPQSFSVLLFFSTTETKWLSAEQSRGSLRNPRRSRLKPIFQFAPCLLSSWLLFGASFSDAQFVNGFQQPTIIR